MKDVNLEVLHDAANRLYFTMSDAEYNTLLEEFKTMISQMKLLGNIEGLDEAKPMTFPFDVRQSYLREDEVENVLSTEDALRNASEIQENQIKLPKVVK